MKDVNLYTGDCLDVLKTLPDNSIDSVVTDPPYGLSFMGQKWDYDVPSEEIWRECLRVLKPGGHLLAFAGTRTQHRMAVRIEDAGFYIADLIAWIHAQGFPKSLNLDRFRGEKFCDCLSHIFQNSHETVPPKDMHRVQSVLAAQESFSIDPQQDLRTGMQREVHQRRQNREGAETTPGKEDNGDAMPSLRKEVLSSECMAKEDLSFLLQQKMQRENPQSKTCETSKQGTGEVDRKELCGISRKNVRCEQSSVEGRHNVSSSPRELCSSSVCKSTGMGEDDGSKGWVCNGTSSGDGRDGRTNAASDGNCSPHRPRSDEQSPVESGATPKQSLPQDVGTWPICRECGKPRIPSGLGTALKPALEPITVARKPFKDAVANTVLKHGTGALNIDACRVPLDREADASQLRTMTRGERETDDGWGMSSAPGSDKTVQVVQEAGRWPSNVLHDGSDEVVRLFPHSTSGAMKASTERAAQDRPGSVCYGVLGGNITTQDIPKSEGSAARFFYCAKISRKDRHEGLSDPGPQFKHGTTLRKVENTQTAGNTHPTVKPTELMRWLVRLVTPPGGLVLDPFMGSGSTGKACVLEGLRFTGIEQNPEWVDVARARILHASKSQPTNSVPAPDLFEMRYTS